MGTHVQDRPPGPQTLPGRRPVIEIGWKPDELDWEKTKPAAKVITAIRAGAHFNEAAVYAEISVDTLRRWLRTGRTYMLEFFGDEATDEDVRSLPPNQQMYVTLFRKCTTAEATIAVEMVGIWRQAAQEDWRAARDFLARRFPANWQPRDRLELSAADAASDGDAVGMDTLLQDPEARKLLAALEERVALGAGDRDRDDIVDLEEVDDDLYVPAPEPEPDPGQDSFGDDLIG